MLHFPEAVSQLGPMWANTCYEFEASNGGIKKLLHGTKRIDVQVIYNHVHRNNNRCFYRFQSLPVHCNLSNCKHQLYLKAALCIACYINLMMAGHSQGVIWYMHTISMINHCNT